MPIIQYCSPTYVDLYSTDIQRKTDERYVEDTHRGSGYDGLKRAPGSSLACIGVASMLKRIWAIAKESRAAFGLSAGVITTKAATTSRRKSASPTTSMTGPPGGFCPS